MLPAAVLPICFPVKVKRLSAICADLRHHLLRTLPLLFPMQPPILSAAMLGAESAWTPSMFRLSNIAAAKQTCLSIMHPVWEQIVRLNVSDSAVDVTDHRFSQSGFHGNPSQAHSILPKKQSLFPSDGILIDWSQSFYLSLPREPARPSAIPCLQRSDFYNDLPLYITSPKNMSGFQAAEQKK